MVTATPAAAVASGFDPTAAPVVIPGTTHEVSEWRLAGALPNGTGEQIAPQWVLASGHSPTPVGATFTNGYGSATVDQTTTCGPLGSGCDVSLSHLSTAIPAPRFPPLLLDGVPDGSNLVLAGDTLAVGRGTYGTPSLQLTAGWTQPTGHGLTLSTIQSEIALAPGDSGGPAYYYYPGTTTAVLQGVMVFLAGGVSGGLQSLNATQVKPFLDGILPPGTVNWVTFDQLGPVLNRPQSVATPTVAATADSITLTWPAVSATPAVTGYRAVLLRTNNPADAMTVTTSADTRTATFTGVPAGQAFGAFVLASNANGESPVPFTTDLGVPPQHITFPTMVAVGAPPSGLNRLSGILKPNGLNITTMPGADAVPDVTQTTLIVNECAPAGCTANPQIQVANITTTDTSTAATTTVVPIPAGTRPGTKFVLQGFERNTLGVSRVSTVTGTYVPHAPPLALTSVTVTPQADGTAVVSYTPPTNVEPNTFGTILTGYLPHAPAQRYQVQLLRPGNPNPLPGKFLLPTELSVRVRLSDFDPSLAPGTYTLQVTAVEVPWGRSAPVAVTTNLGTVADPPPPPVTTTVTPTAPLTPTNVTISSADGHFGDVTWVQPTAPGVATPDEYVVVLQCQNHPEIPPTVAEVSATSTDYFFPVPCQSQYGASVYALSQQLGASAPGTAVSAASGS